jgi:drug/metabolite transporter (DMT)-like permease
MISKRQERIGEMFILSQVALYGLFPVVINYSVKLIPPILYAGISSLVASAFLFIFVVYKKNLKQLFNKKALPYMLGVTLFIIIIPSIFIFTGTKMTSGVNTTILFQVEVLFTFIICGMFCNEKITVQKMLGALVIVIGTILVVYNGTFVLNWGDLLIIIGVFFYPFGNIAAKKALRIVPPTVILFIRSFLGGLALVLFSLAFEKSFNQIVPSFHDYFLYIAINGIVIMFISKVLWYEGLRRIDITKAIPIDMSFPAFSLLFLFIFVQEIPNGYQFIGLIFTMLGVGFITLRRSSKILQFVRSFYRKKEEKIPPFS